MAGKCAGRQAQIQDGTVMFGTAGSAYLATGQEQGDDREPPSTYALPRDGAAGIQTIDYQF